MDSLTHLFVGGDDRRRYRPLVTTARGLLAGAVLKSLPDLDVFPLLLSDDPVTRMVWHRGLTHSVLVLPWIAWGLWAWFRRRGRWGAGTAPLVLDLSADVAHAPAAGRIYRLGYATALAVAAADDVVEPVHYRSGF